jgi:hypothetical protein
MLVIYVNVRVQRVGSGSEKIGPDDLQSMYMCEFVYSTTGTRPKRTREREENEEGTYNKRE